MTFCLLDVVSSGESWGGPHRLGWGICIPGLYMNRVSSCLEAKGNSTHIGLALSLYCPLLQGHTWHPEYSPSIGFPATGLKCGCLYAATTARHPNVQSELTVPSEHLWLPRSGFMFLAHAGATRAHFRGRKGPLRCAFH